MTWCEWVVVSLVIKKKWPNYVGGYWIWVPDTLHIIENNRWLSKHAFVIFFNFSSLQSFSSFLSLGLKYYQSVAYLLDLSRCFQIYFWNHSSLRMQQLTFIYFEFKLCPREIVKNKSLIFRRHTSVSKEHQSCKMSDIISNSCLCQGICDAGWLKKCIHTFFFW